jgi:RNA-splicing ligase RtcB
MEFTGTFNTCKVFCEPIENELIPQIKAILNSSVFKDKKIRFMPDAHPCVGVPVGFTAELDERVIPNVIGADVGCGVTCFNLGKIQLKEGDFKQLDKFIRANIPDGMKRRNKAEDPVIEYICEGLSINYQKFISDIARVCKNTNQNMSTALQSLGTLGGSNHYIELDIDSTSGETYLVVHSGSRGFGLQIAKYYQILASKKPQENGTAKSLEYLEGSDAQAYIDDMKIAQKYAQINRYMMGYLIIKHLRLRFNKVKVIESIHNYIDFDKEPYIIRKGAISACKDQPVIIPLNMADGAILGFGKGNADWNESAPHGSGRKYSRIHAKEHVSMDAYRSIMKENHIWSSCINPDTIDESPFVYKDSEYIIKTCENTINITKIIKPIYNFKAIE